MHKTLSIRPLVLAMLACASTGSQAVSFTQNDVTLDINGTINGFYVNREAKTINRSTGASTTTSNSALTNGLLPGWINFVAGIGALTLVVAVTAATGLTPLEPATEMPLWALAPGLLGAAFVTLGAWAVGGIGVLVLGLLSVTGQIFTALIFDLHNPKVGILMDARTGVAALLALAAAFVSSRRRVPGDMPTH